MANAVTKIWAGWFQNVHDEILNLGETCDSPPFKYEILDNQGIPTRMWGPGFFQSVTDAINRLFVAAVLPDVMPPPLITTKMLFNADRNFQLAWVGWMQAVTDSIVTLGGPKLVAPFNAPLIF